MTDWVGEDLAAKAGEPDGKENMFYRSVLVSVWPADERAPRPPDPKPLVEKNKEPAAKQFKIRAVRGYSVSIETTLHLVSVEADQFEFEIVDVEKKLVATYKYFGKGLNLSWSKSFFRVTGMDYLGGKWQTFDAPHDWSLEQFRGNASLTGWGADSGVGLPPPQGWSDLALPRTKHWYSIASTKSHIKKVDFGDSKGLPTIGAGRSEGPFFMVGEPRPYRSE